MNDEPRKKLTSELLTVMAVVLVACGLAVVAFLAFMAVALHSWGSNK